MVKRRALRRKLGRDVRQNAMQFLALTLLCFLGTWAFAGLDGNWRMDETTIETWIEKGRLCDFWVRGTGFSPNPVGFRHRINAVAHHAGRGMP